MFNRHVLSSCRALYFVLGTLFFAKHKVQSTKFTAQLFVTTTPELSRKAVRLRVRAAQHASLRAGGRGGDRPQPHCSLLPQRSAAPVRARPETPSTQWHN